MVSKPSIWLPLFDEFIQNLRINSKEESTADGSGTKLDLWESQRRFMQEVAHGLDRGVRTFYCLKSRQLGITTVSLAIDIFWMALNPGMTGALVTENEANRDKNRKVLKQYIESFPEGYFGDKFGIKSDNRNAMSFTNGSRLDFKVAGTKDKGTSWAEGEGYAYAHLTETAAYGSADGLRSFEEAFAQVNPKRLFLYESTAKGFGLWRDTWLAGKQDPYTKHSFFIGWWASATNRIERSDPRFAEFGRDKPDAEERERIKQVRDLYDFEVIPEQLAWYRWRDDNPSSDEGVMAQNQPWTADDAFVTSGQSFFQTRQVSKDITVITDNPDSYAYLAYAYEYGATFFDMRLHVLEDEDDPREIELKVWEEPVIGGRYVIGCDPAYGRTDHGDAIAIEVYRCYADKLVQVAEYCTAQVEVKYAAWTLAHLAGAYSNCIVNLEIYGGGSVILNEWDNLRQMIGSGNYDGAVRAGNWEDALNNARWYLYNRPDSMGAGYAIGFNTTHKAKMELMYAMRGSYTTRELEIRSVRMLNEMNMVVQEGQIIGAPESRDINSKDDRVFASAFAHRAWVDWRRKEMMAENATYERITAEENGTASKHTRSMNGMVERFFAHQALLAGSPGRVPTWRQQRGLE